MASTEAERNQFPLCDDVRLVAFGEAKVFLDVSEPADRAISGRLAGHIISSLLLLAPPEFSWVAAAHSLLGPPVAKQLRQAVIMVPAKAGSFGQWFPNMWGWRERFHYLLRMGET